MDLGLKGKAALVTGGSKGIGKAVARGLAQEGAKVTICARTRAELEAAAAELGKATGSEVFAVAGDLTREADVQKIVDAAVSRFGRIDILVNNAGTAPGGLLLDLAEEQWQQATQLAPNDPAVADLRESIRGPAMADYPISGGWPASSG